MRRYKAKWLIKNHNEILENVVFFVENGQIKDIRKQSFEKVIDLGDKVISPAFINTHTHLELSFLKDKINTQKGFQFWVKELLEKRKKAKIKDILKSIKDAIIEIKKSGTIAICDISTLGLSKDLFLKSELLGTYFLEHLGENLPHLGFKKGYEKNISNAAHAPHTTSSDLICHIKKNCNKHNLIFSIHVAESEEEEEFIKDKKGSWANFLESKKINFNRWQLPQKSSVEYLKKLKTLDEKTICVHLNFANKKDFEIIKESGASVSVCPRSNVKLHNRLSNLKEILDRKINATIGTDSLASTDSLSILDEASFLFENNQEINPKEIFKMATINGAKALSLEKKIGSLEIGKNATFISIDKSVKSKKDIFENILIIRQKKYEN